VVLFLALTDFVIPLTLTGISSLEKPLLSELIWEKYQAEE
jgi:hypothetical protein